MPFINPNYVQMNKDFTLQEQALAFIADWAAELGLLKRGESILVDLKARETEYSTAIGNGFAIPHAKTNKVKQAAILILKLNQVIEWGEEAVRVIIAIISPQSGGEHLKLLAGLSRKLMHPEFRQAVIDAEDEVSLYRVFTKVEEELYV